MPSISTTQPLRSSATPTPQATAGPAPAQAAAPEATGTGSLARDEATDVGAAAVTIEGPGNRMSQVQVPVRPTYDAAAVRQQAETLWAGADARDPLDANHPYFAALPVSLEDGPGLKAYLAKAPASNFSREERLGYEKNKAAVDKTIVMSKLGGTPAAKATQETIKAALPDFNPKTGAYRKQLEEAGDKAALARWDAMLDRVNRAFGSGDYPAVAAGIALINAGLAKKPAHMAAAEAFMQAHAEKSGYETTLDRAEQQQARAKGAIELLGANAGAETQALAKLSPDAQQQYAQLKAQTAQAPQARLALQMLLLEGKLTGAQSAEGRTLLAELSRLGAAVVPQELPRDAMLQQVLLELAHPTAIAQHDKWTCAATSAQIMMATQRPAEYVRILTGLATEGRVNLSNQDTLVREEGTLLDDGSGRTHSGRLFQAAMTEYANGDLVDYDNATDMQIYQDGKQAKGLGNLGMTIRMFETAQGGALEHFMKDDETTGSQMLTYVGMATAKGMMVPVIYEAGGGAQHAIVMTGVTDSQVHFIDPYGKQVTASREQMAELLVFASIPGSALQ